jgi:hypothetical protein
MKRSTLLMAFMTMAMASASAFAQQTGGGVTADNLYQYLAKQGTVTARKAGVDCITLLDKGNGSELCSVRFMEPQVVTVSRSIAKVDLRSAAAARVMSAMATFNFSSPVGTLLLDEKTGALRMEHNLNPQSMSTETLAGVAVMFGQVAETESRQLVGMMGKDMGMLVR